MIIFKWAELIFVGFLCVKNIKVNLSAQVDVLTVGSFTIFIGDTLMAFWSDLGQNIKTYFTDWVKSGVLQEDLHSRALALRKPINQKLLEKNVLHSSDYGKSLPKNATDQELFQCFMFSGVDYRGQAQHYIETLGYGAGVTMSVDLMKAFTPPTVSLFTTATISANLSGKTASCKFLLIANQGEYRELNVPHVPADSWKPAVLSCMKGTWRNMKGGLGVEAGVKFDTSDTFGLDIGVSKLEVVSLGVKLTGSANASMEGSWMMVTDSSTGLTDFNVDTLHISSRETDLMNIWFSQHLGSISTFKAIKDQFALKINPSCYLSWWIGTKEADAAINAQASVTAGAKMGSFKDESIGPGGELSFTGKGPSIKWTSKTSAYRLNVPFCIDDIIQSQETKILYKQVGGQLLGLALDLELGCAVIKHDAETNTNSVSIEDPQTLFVPSLTQKISPSVFSDYADKKTGAKTTVTETIAPPDLSLYKTGNFAIALTSKSLKMSLLEDTFKKVEKKWETVNSMSYEIGMAIWSKTDKQLLEGSGFVVGQSISLPTFVTYWSNAEQCKEIKEFNEPIPAVDKVVKLLPTHVKALLYYDQITVPTLQAWLNSSNTGDTRWNIKKVDNAIEAFWKHMNTSPWNQKNLYDLLLVQAKKKCGAALNSGTQEEKNRLLYAQLVSLTLQEVKARTKLYAAIIEAIDKWFVSKNGVKAAASNARYPAVSKLLFKCDHDAQQLNRFASIYDVIKEYFDMRKLEADLTKSLHIDIEDLRTFLANEGLQGAVKDIVDLQRVDKSQVPGAFLIEVAFKLQPDDLLMLSNTVNFFKPNNIDLQDNFSIVMKNAIEKKFTSKLQSISIRYRKADTKDSNRSFKLGVNVGAAKLGFSLDRVRNSTTEGNFMVSTVWFRDYKSVNHSEKGQGWPERTVPMPMIIS